MHLVGAGFLYRQHADNNCAMLPSGPAKLILGRMAFSSAFSVTECSKLSSVYDFFLWLFALVFS